MSRVQSRQLAALAEAALDEVKARDVRVIDVRKLTTLADYMIIATGTSDRHVRSLAERVVEQAASAGCKPLGVEGQEAGEWILVDLQDVIVHVMLGKIRDLYKLENLWDMHAGPAEAAR
jgi:ribosome-associated protein